MEHQNHRLKIAETAAAYRVKLAEMKNAKAVLRAAVIEAIQSGVSENEVAKLSGLARMTVRDWQGKK